MYLMRKMITLLITSLTTIIAIGQDITEQNLQGDWKMCAFDVNGIHWDFKTDTVKLPAEYEGTLGQSQKDALIADIKGGLADYKEGTFMIKGNYIEQSMNGDVASGTYTIENMDGLDYLRVVNDDAAKSVDMLRVLLKDGQMHITIPDEIGGASTLIYCR